MTIEEEWQLFALYIKLKKNTVQYTEMRKAFYAGAATAVTHVNMGPEGTLEKLLEQITDYYWKEVACNGNNSTITPKQP